MKSLNTYETIGIFLSIFVMIAVLGAIRFKTDMLGNTEDAQSAVVVVANEEQASLEQALRDAYDPGGELVKLVVDDIEIGTKGREVEDGDTITIHYIGETQDRVRFTDSYAKHRPYTFTIGNGTMIEGIEKGLIGMKVGGKRVLVIPSTMAYGNKEVGNIPANATLVFTVELLEIR